jgi:hypothetical protein
LETIDQAMLGRIEESFETMGDASARSIIGNLDPQI